MVYDDFFYQQSDDALARNHINVLCLSAQTFEKFPQRVNQPQVRGLIGKLGIQRFQFSFQACLPLAQFWHALT